MMCAFAMVLVAFLPFETKDKKLCETFEEHELRCALEEKRGDVEEASMGLLEEATIDAKVTTKASAYSTKESEAAVVEPARV